MNRTRSVVVFAAWLCLSGTSLAHHSVGINFDSSKAFTLTGVLKEIDTRNPHSQITLSVKGADGTVKDWFLEWSDKKRADSPQSGLRADEDRGNRDDHLHDDPAMRCIPATFKRVMHTPSPPIEVKLHEEYAEINYEFMDIHRRVPIKAGLAARMRPTPCPSSPISRGCRSSSR